MLRNTLKRNKGITLIALVVTIIVLLILAGISIMMLTGQNGILNRASEAKENTGTSQTEELVKLSVTDALTQGLGSLTDTNLKAALDNNLGAGKYQITGDAENGWTITVDGKEFKVDATGNITGDTTGGENLKDLSAYQTNETKPYLPDNTKFERVKGTDLTTGLVIQETATGSEYVWVEVPKTTAVYQKAGLSVTNFDDNYTKIENDLHEYTKVYRNNTNYSDVYAADSTDTDGWFADSNAYDTAKKKMLKSVYQNGGFWVGRYEAGIKKNRTENGNATIMPLSKENLYPYTYVTRTQAKVLAEQVESGSYTSSLMFGVQWDLVLKYIETKKSSTIEDIQNKLNSSSTPIGNYYTSSFTLNRGKFAQYDALSKWYDFNSKDKTSLVTGGIKQWQNSDSNAILLTTGAAEATNLQNIYDIAGNVWEWTLEKTSNTNYPCANRGGSCGNGGSSGPASYRNDSLTSDSYYDFGFRVSLY